ncbi:sodium:proton antiporter [Mucilaginibacter hurinus]|uniref:Sodium:proton antiporter n=1 Tax=Mucilaginibacter hurinus TaxID=2201324 RepID=A0A367GQQ9_9SPHI|nr:cation:proton antiporter [Mucilaginibacter hurinus]RCH55206.1 sodium:proton antiporter [Mucilaginibacter hurinus]
MVHLPQLITDLGLTLAAAAVTTLVFKKIKQPLVLGYILAGILIGPHFSFIPTVADEKSIAIWAEIGVIFLLFSLGLEFSFKKLTKVGGAASITATVEAVSMFGFGYLAGALMGWSAMDSIFLGGILSVSSTTIIIRAFEELGVKHKKFAGLVFGVLIVEDLIAILLLVLLTTLSVSRQFAGDEMLISVLKLGFFLTLWFLGGIFLVPTFLNRTRKLMNDETMLIVSLALCLLMVILAVQAGFSPALGAFIMGSILAETSQAERIEHLTKSVKDLFAAIFFVSVGMLINPAVLVEYAGPVFIITGVTIAGKLISTSAGALLSGQPLKTSVQAGMSLAQIGEFSFIIATLGLTLKVTSEFLYPIAVAVSAITTFTTPYLIKVSDPFYNFIERTVPKKWITNINSYSNSTQSITTSSDWKVLLKSYLFNFFIHSVIIIALIFLSERFLHPFVAGFIDEPNANYVTLAITFLLMAPFLWAIAIRRIQKKAYSHLWLNNKYSRGPLVALEGLRVALAVFFVGFLLNIFFDTILAIGFAALIIALAILVFSRKLQSFYNRLEKRFFNNLNEREIENPKAGIVPWDAHLSELTVSSGSGIIGKTLAEIAVREQYGVNIALIERGKHMITTPARDERIYPYDKLLVIGTDEQMARIKAVVEVAEPYNGDEQEIKNAMQLHKINLSSKSPVCGHSIRDSGIRENTQGLVVGIERNGERILNPDSTLVFEPGDTVWIVGNSKRVTRMLKP